jgi:hypothetical protein
MLRRIVTAPLALLALALAPQAVAAAAPPPPAVVRSEAGERAIYAWLGRLGEAMTIQNRGMQKLSGSRALMEQMATPAGAKAAAPRLRALVAEARASVRQADALLASTSLPDLVVGNGLTPASMLAEARAQNAKAIAVLDDYDALLAAFERGDRAAAVKLAPRLMEGSMVLVDGQRLMMRGRQAALPQSQSMHQALELPVQLYRAMAFAGRAWLTARVGGRAEAGAAQLRSETGAAAAALRDAARTGRVHLAAERAPIEAAAGGRMSERDKADYAVIRTGWAVKERLFELEEELAGLLEAGGSVSPAALAAQATPRLLGDLAAFELRYTQMVAGSAAQISAGRTE